MSNYIQDKNEELYLMTEREKRGRLTLPGRYGECQLSQLRCRGTTAFIQYLRKHQSRIIHYQALQEAGGSVGSGAVESLVKQIGLRVKLPGAQWRRENVPHLLKHRCAYLNGAFAPSLF